MVRKLKRFIIQHPILVLFAVSLLTRFLWVRFGMPSVTDDEADIYTNAYILARTGRDYFGNTFFLTTGILTPKPVVTVLIASLPWLFTGVKSVFLARLPFVFLNSVTPVLLYILVNRITKNRGLSALCFGVLNFSPWFSYASVTGYEAMVALFFMLLFFVVLTSGMMGKKKLVLAAVISFLIFNSYQGMKPVFPFLMFTGLVLYALGERIKLDLRKYVMFVFVSVILFASFVAINYYAPNADLTRKEYAIMTSDKGHIDGAVWFERWTTSGPPVIARLIANKYMLRGREYLSKYMLSFDPAIFFQKGDPSATYGTADLSGLFYLTDFIFFVFGLLTIIRFNNARYKILVMMLFFGGLSMMLATTLPTLLFRAIPLIIPYTLLIGYGMYILYVKTGNKLLPAGLILLFLINTLTYTTVFDLRIKNLNAEKWRHGFMSIDRIVPSLQHSYSKITLYNQQAQEFFFQYAFYNISDPVVITTAMKKMDYRYENITVTDGCPKKPQSPTEVVMFNKENCNPTIPGTRMLYTIPAMDHSGKDYFILTGI